MGDGAPLGWVFMLGTIALLVDEPHPEQAARRAIAYLAHHRRHPIDPADLASRPATLADLAAFDRARDGADIQLLRRTAPEADDQPSLF